MINVIGNIINENGYTMILHQNDYKNDQEVETLIAFIKRRNYKELSA